MLTETRKADRETMATKLAALAIECGASAEIDHIRPREVWVKIRANRGLCVTIDFSGESPQPDTHVVRWHMAADVDTCFSDAFQRHGCGSINPHHFRKATAIAEGFDELCDTIEAGLLMARDGDAFDDAREAAAIAKAGETAAQRNARYDAWREAV